MDLQSITWRESSSAGLFYCVRTTSAKIVCCYETGSTWGSVRHEASSFLIPF